MSPRRPLRATSPVASAPAAARTDSSGTAASATSASATAVAARVASAVAAAGAALLAVGVLAAGRSRAETPPPPAGRSVAAGAIDTSPAPRQAASELVPCEVPVVRRDTLRDEQGRPFFLAPDALHVREGTLLIAGHHSAYVRADADGRALDGEQDAVLVALRAPDGRTRTFPRPDEVGDVPLQPVRVAPLPERRWAVLLADRVGAVENAVDRHVWLAVLGAEGWQSVTRIAPPPGVRILEGASEPLAADGEHLLAALPAIRHDDEYGAVLVEGTAARLTTRFLPLHGVAYTAATFAGSGAEPALFAVHANRSVTRSGNAFFLYFPDRSGAKPRLLTDGVASAIHAPHVFRVNGGFRVVALERSHIDRTAPDQLVDIHVSDQGDAVVQPLASGADRIASARVDADAVIAAYTSLSTSGTIEVTLFRRPGPGRGMRVPVSPPHSEVLGVAQDGASEVVVATILGNVFQAMVPSLALTWVTPRCRATSGRGDAR